MGREVALKEYLPSALAVRQDGVTVLPRSTKMAEDFTWGRERFVSEGQTLASLHGAPAIVHVFDFLEANGTAYIVMELLSGETLEDRLKRDGKLDAEAVDKILWPLLDGLEQVHKAGFLHRDIKPANILLNREGKPTLIDFGASRAAMVGRTTALTAIFTPGYAAAEQMTSARQGPWTDIYGLSATLYHAITGQTPPSAFDRMLDDKYQPLARLAPPGFSRGLCAGIDAGLNVVSISRPQSIAGWRPILGMTSAPAATATVVMGKGATSTAGPATTPAPKRPFALWVAAAAVFVALLGGGGYYLTAMRGPDPEMMKVRAAADAAEAARLKAEQEAAALRAEREQRAKAEQEAAERQKQAAAEAERQKRLEEEARKKIASEIAEQQKAEADRKRADEEARRKADEEAEVRQNIVADRPCRPAGRDPPPGGGHRRRSRSTSAGGQRAGQPAPSSALPADRPADRRHAALSLPDHPAQRQAAARPDSRRRPDRPGAGAGAQWSGARFLRRATGLCRCGGRSPWSRAVVVG